MQALTKRPRTLEEVARRAISEDAPFGASLREFLDSFYDMDQQERKEAINAEPACLGMLKDAYIAAVAEELARTCAIEPPEWTEGKGRFLKEPFFASDLQSLKATLIKESPIGFRRRLLFVSENALSRPRSAPAPPKP